MKKSFWVVTLDSNTCRIYDFDRKEQLLKLIKEWSHPENKLRNVDLVSDRPGHYKAPQTSRGAFADVDTHEELIRRFTHEVADLLYKHHREFEKFIAIVPPRVLGFLNQYLDEAVKEKMLTSLKKDYMHWSSHELQTYLRDHWDDIIP